MKKSDPRIPVIRCRSCHRLRQHPRTDDPRTHYCGCGGVQFIGSFPHPDEMQIAMKLYSRELEERNWYGRIAAEILNDWRSKYGRPDDQPERRIIITG